MSKDFVNQLNCRTYEIKSEFIKDAKAKFRRYNNRELEDLLLVLDIEDTKKLSAKERENLYLLKTIEFLQNLKSDDTPDIETLHESFFHECILFVWSIGEASSSSWRFSCPHCRMVNEVELSITDITKKYDAELLECANPIELEFDLSDYKGKEKEKFTIYFKPFTTDRMLNHSMTKNGELSKYIDYAVDSDNTTINFVDDEVKEVFVNKLYPNQKDMLVEALTNRNKVIWRKKITCVNSKCAKPIIPFSEDFVNFFVTQLVMQT